MNGLVKMGYRGILKYGPAGKTPSERLPKTADVSIALEKGTADATTRDSAGWRETVPTLKNATLEITVVRDAADAAFVFFANALETDTKVALFADDGTGEGFDGDFHVSELADSQALEDVEKLTVSCTPAGRFHRIYPEPAEPGPDQQESGGEA